MAIYIAARKVLLSALLRLMQEMPILTTSMSSLSAVAITRQLTILGSGGYIFGIMVVRILMTACTRIALSSAYGNISLLERRKYYPVVFHSVHLNTRNTFQVINSLYRCIWALVKTKNKRKKTRYWPSSQRMFISIQKKVKTKCQWPW